MSDPSHTRTVEKIEYTDKHGKKRVRHKVLYARSEKTEAEMEKLRLGVFADIKATTDPKALAILEQTPLIITAPYAVARTLISTRVRQNKKPHKVLTGPDILRSYLDRSGGESGEGLGSMSLLEGFPQFPQLYILFSYLEAPNQYLSSLVVQLVGQRYHNNSHVWLMIPRDLASVSAQWTPALLDLNYITKIKIESLDDMEGGDGPDVHTPVKKPPQPENPGSMIIRDVGKDNKFRSKDKR